MHASDQKAEYVVKELCPVLMLLLSTQLPFYNMIRFTFHQKSTLFPYTDQKEILKISPSSHKRMSLNNCFNSHFATTGMCSAHHSTFISSYLEIITIQLATILESRCRSVKTTNWKYEYCFSYQNGHHKS